MIFLRLLLVLPLLQQICVSTKDVTMQDMQPAVTLASTNQCLCDFHTALVPEQNNKLLQQETLWFR